MHRHRMVAIVVVLAAGAALSIALTSAGDVPVAAIPRTPARSIAGVPATVGAPATRRHARHPVRLTGRTAPTFRGRALPAAWARLRRSGDRVLVSLESSGPRIDRSQSALAFVEAHFDDVAALLTSHQRAQLAHVPAGHEHERLQVLDAISARGRSHGVVRLKPAVRAAPGATTRSAQTPPNPPRSDGTCNEANLSSVESACDFHSLTYTTSTTGTSLGGAETTLTVDESILSLDGCPAFCTLTTGPNAGQGPYGGYAGVPVSDIDFLDAHMQASDAATGAVMDWTDSISRLPTLHGTYVDAWCECAATYAHWRGSGTTSSQLGTVTARTCFTDTNHFPYYDGPSVLGAWFVLDSTYTGPYGAYGHFAVPCYDGAYPLSPLPDDTRWVDPAGTPASGPAAAEQLGPQNGSEPNVVGCAEGKPVSCATGNQYVQSTDLRIGGRGLGLALTRTYNSQAAAAQSSPGTLGYGWTGAYSDRLVVDAAAKRATVKQADGSSVIFTLAPSGTYTAPGWVQSTLVATAGGYDFKLPDRTVLSFDSAGQLTAERDFDANATTIAHDGAGRIATVTDPAHRALTYAYDAAGRLGSVTDLAARKVTYAYDAAGNLTSATLPDGGVWRYGYDVAHQLTSETDPRGATTQTAYDSSHRAISQTDALHRSRRWSYGQDGDGHDQTTIAEPNGSITEKTFVNGEPIRVTRAKGTPRETTTTIAYDDAAAPIRLTDGNGHVQRIEYDGAGNRTSVTDASGKTTTYAYDDERRVLKLTSPSGRTQQFTYDAAGNMKTMTRASADGATSEQETYTHNSAGDLLSITDALAHTTLFGYDSAGDRTSTTTALGHKSTFAYNAISQLISAVTANGNEPSADPSRFRTTWTLDAAGRPTAAIAPLARRSSQTYDAAGNLATRTDAAGRTTTYAYDAQNEPTTVRAPDGSVTRTAYDDAGEIVRQTDANGHDTTYARDELEHVTATTDPLGRTSQTAYDDAGNPTSTTDALGRTVSRSYDAANRLTHVSYSSGDPADADIDYDRDGRVIKDGDVLYAYDALGRLASTSNAAAGRTRYAYDAAGRLTQIGYPNILAGHGLTVTHSLDADDRITAIDDGAQHIATYAYDAEGRPTSIARPDGGIERDGYDAAGQLTSLTDSAGSTYSFNGTYAYTAAAQLSGADESRNTLGSNAVYGYDAAGRLATNGFKAGYDYDAAGNPTTLAMPSALTGTLGGLGHVTGLASYDSVAQSFDAANELTAARNAAASSTTTLSYDAIGERVQAVIAATSTTTLRYGYDQAGQLRSATSSATSSTDAYTYDATGLRATQRAGQLTPNAWDRSSGLPLLLSDGSSQYVYGPDNVPLEAVRAAGVTVVYHHDNQGSTRAITTTNGLPLATYSYDAYGAVNGGAKLAAAVNPFLYRGQYTDAATGLQYLRARYYDPASAQFLTRDPLHAVTGQPYSYADDDPTDASDPTGLSCGWSSPWDCAGAAGDALYEYSGQISTVASALAFVPGVDIVAAPIAIGAGLLHGYQDYRDHNYVGMVFDVAGAGAGIGGMALKGEADAWMAAERAAWNRGYMRPWAVNEAAQAAGRYKQFSFGSYAAGSLFDPLLHPENAAGAICGGL